MEICISLNDVLHVPVSDSLVDRSSFSDCRDKVKKSSTTEHELTINNLTISHHSGKFSGSGVKI